MVIANGKFKEINTILDIVHGKKIGTFFTVAENNGISVEDQAIKGSCLNYSINMQSALRWSAESLLSEAYPGLRQACKMKSFTTINNRFYLLTIVVKFSILHACGSPAYAF